MSAQRHIVILLRESRHLTRRRLLRNTTTVGTAEVLAGAVEAEALAAAVEAEALAAAVEAEVLAGAVEAEALAGGGKQRLQCGFGGRVRRG